MFESEYFAHSANEAGRWHSLPEHLVGVAKLAGKMLAGWKDAEEEVYLAGLLHDLGKYGDSFQARLRGERSGLDHWSAGAWTALKDYGCIGAALAIQGHHVGLQQLDVHSLKGLSPDKLQKKHPLQLELTASDPGCLLQRLKNDVQTLSRPTTTLLQKSTQAGIARMLLVRLLFSALVDADFLDTEAHFQGDAGGKRYRLPGQTLQPARALEYLQDFLIELRQNRPTTPVIAKAREILLEECLQASVLPPGLFTLTAPTGCGKTLAMLAFALAHAGQHSLQRVVMVIPYLSIIEQTATLYRQIFQHHLGEHYILEHHSLAGQGAEGSEDDAVNGFERRRRLLSENWDAPLVVTTSVQLLESLFSNRPGRCRKLHRLRNSVILFDEVQTLPPNLAIPTLAALSHLAADHNTTVVFSTATQPAFDHLDASVRQQVDSGWQPREVVPSSERLFALIKGERRTEVQWQDGACRWSWEILADRLRQENQVMCVLNLKKQAKALWEALADRGNQEGLLHLSTNLCPAHRQKVLEEVRQRLKAGQPCRLVATQCVEAGVDLDFPRVYRAFGPLEAIIQAAGRCNREGDPAGGEVVIFHPEEARFPGDGYRTAAAVTEQLLKERGAAAIDLYDPELIRDYYRRLYDLGRPDLSAKTQDILEPSLRGDFREVANQYKLIKEDTISVVVPYLPLMALYESLRDRVAGQAPDALWLREARPLVVSLYRPKGDDPVYDALLPIARPPRSRKQRQREEWFVYQVADDYHPVLGLCPSGKLNLWIA